MLGSSEKYEGRYTEHQDMLFALVSYLATTSKLSVSAQAISKNLDLDCNDVQEVLESFKSLFRKSVETFKTSSGEQDYMFTLHLRYGFRSQAKGNVNSEVGKRDPLSADLISALLDFISQQVAREQEHNLTNLKLSTMVKEAKKTRNVSIVTAFIAAVTAIVVGFKL